MAIGIGLLAGAAEAADFCRAGLALKTDIPNEIVAPAGRLLLFDTVMLEAYPVGWVGEYEGIGLRALGLGPQREIASGIAWRPYLGVGFARVEREIEVTGFLPDLPFWGDRVDIAPVTALGRGGQVVGGVQLFRSRSRSRFTLEIEAFYSFFTVDAEARIRVDGAEPLLGDPPIAVFNVEADYKAFGFGIGLGLLFW